MGKKARNTSKAVPRRLEHSWTRRWPNPQPADGTIRGRCGALSGWSRNRLNAPRSRAARPANLFGQRYSADTAGLRHKKPWINHKTPRLWKPSKSQTSRRLILPRFVRLCLRRGGRPYELQGDVYSDEACDQCGQSIWATDFEENHRIDVEELSAGVFARTTKYRDPNH